MIVVLSMMITVMITAAAAIAAVTAAAATRAVFSLAQTPMLQTSTCGKADMSRRQRSESTPKKEV